MKPVKKETRNRGIKNRISFTRKCIEALKGKSRALSDLKGFMEIKKKNPFTGIMKLNEADLNRD